MPNENLPKLEDRIVEFACLCLEVCDLLPNTKSGDNLEQQLSKSATTCALLYVEANAAQSKTDFIRKIKIALKEVRVLRITLLIIRQRPTVENLKVDLALTEANGLISFFLKIMDTTQTKRSIKHKTKD